ncbi:MAG: cytochrome c, class I [Rhodocyclaceae bacterium]|nr:cytochrome c, class I [Rhodocyclaceae bacterium]
MPAKGGATDLPDADIKAAVDYMVAAAKDGGSGAAATAPAAAAPAAAAAAATKPRPAALSFNRLLKPASKRNPPPPEDGIHDPQNDGTHALQPPLQVFESLPRSNAGNRVDWVKALDNNLIAPRWDRTDPAAAPVVMDLNIVREVKGSMPDVVYPHKQHTAWLDCSNCHPQIFIPQKGANQISMAAILLGQKCGVCHGKVAFPVSECRICHSKKKNVMPVKNAQAN